MSMEYARYQPATPPDVPFEEYLASGHSRNASGSSIYSSESSPWSTMTGNTSPGTSPTRHYHGPTLLPKIRPQDVVVEPVSAGGPLRHRRVLSNTRNPPGFVPYPPSRPVPRHRIDPGEGLSLVSPISPVYSVGQRSVSALSSPVTTTAPPKRKAGGSHSRSVSTPSIDDNILRRYGYPTYRQLPKYVEQVQSQTTPTTPVTPVTPQVVVYPPYSQRPTIELSQHVPGRPQVRLAVPSARYNCSQTSSAQTSPVTLISPQEDRAPLPTNLHSYLTSPTQAINLVRNVSVVPTRGMHDYFWWDIRNLRSWTSFSLATLDSIPRLPNLMKTEISAILTPPVCVAPTRLSPESEPALVNLIRDLYAPRVNAALAVSQGPDHLQLYAAPDVRSTGNKNQGHPHFLANYASDTDCTSAGLIRGRLVGIVKSFGRWNSGMRNEAPHRRVEYLNGLAHLQRCMREHSCRYGFIMTEIELVCVRAGCDDGGDVPYFGYLEISSPIPLKTAAGEVAKDVPPLATPTSARSYLSSSSSSSSSYRPRRSSPVPELRITTDNNLTGPMTASLALYFLLMLSKSVPLPCQPSAHLDVGGPGALTRQRILPEPKDKWIPMPQIGEQRDAKRVRGWVWPQDAWHRREGGGAARSRMGETKTKRWHK
ncbi:uncharacterized protein PFLUO_LOCUS6800 [Penicillium psychrofluorescens]|uniref:uncharacterized protein n=1 Tax=Penicillium psychrofluorescens TaxID=3158075 RepID=UPI003CCDAE1B